jgi:hypothetical protein
MVNWSSKEIQYIPTKLWQVRENTLEQLLKLQRREASNNWEFKLEFSYLKTKNLLQLLKNHGFIFLLLTSVSHTQQDDGNVTEFGKGWLFQISAVLLVLYW